MRNKWVTRVNIVFWIIGSITILFLAGILLVQNSFAGYRWEAINMTQDQIYMTYGVQTKTVGANESIGLIHDNAFLFNRGTSLKIGSTIFHTYDFRMEVTERNAPISFRMSNDHLVERNIVRVKNPICVSISNITTESTIISELSARQRIRLYLKTTILGIR
jgi:hypothetical protein